MTFNEGVQIDTSTTSTSGSGGGRRLAIGGGLGGLLVVVVAMLLGVDPGGVLSQQPLDTRDHVAPGFDLSQCRTGADANRFVQCRVVATGNSVDAVWKPLLPGYTRPHMRLFSGQVGTGCGPASSEVGPFYCPVDKTAYFDTDFFQVLVTHPVPVAAHSRKSMWWPMNTAITCRTCWGCSAALSRVRKVLRAVACARSCRRTATPGCGHTTRPPSSRRAPVCLTWSR